MAKRGRKTKTYPINEIEEIVQRYIIEENSIGFIKYSKVNAFSNKLFESGELKHKLSEDFWRKKNRQGCQVIDSINELYVNTLNKSKTIEYVDNNNITIINTEELVEEMLKQPKIDKRLLINKLKINEGYAKKFLKANKVIVKLQGTNLELESKLKQKEETIEVLESALFSFFNKSRTDEILVDLLNTGKTRSKLVDYFFEKMFNSPKDAYDKLKIYKTSQQQNDDKIVQFSETRIQRLISEKFKK